jgi:hypothetical protein
MSRVSEASEETAPSALVGLPQLEHLKRPVPGQAIWDYLWGRITPRRDTTYERPMNEHNPELHEHLLTLENNEADLRRLTRSCAKRVLSMLKELYPQSVVERISDARHDITIIDQNIPVSIRVLYDVCDREILTFCSEDVGVMPAEASIETYEQIMRACLQIAAEYGCVMPIINPGESIRLRFDSMVRRQTDFAWVADRAIPQLLEAFHILRADLNLITGSESIPMTMPDFGMDSPWPGLDEDVFAATDNDVENLESSHYSNALGTVREDTDYEIECIIYDEETEVQMLVEISC